MKSNELKQVQAELQTLIKEYKSLHADENLSKDKVLEKLTAELAKLEQKGGRPTSEMWRLLDVYFRLAN